MQRSFVAYWGAVSGVPLLISDRAKRIIRALDANAHDPAPGRAAAALRPTGRGRRVPGRLRTSAVTAPVGSFEPMIGGAVVLVLGLLLVFTARAVAGGLNDMRAEGVRQSSLYSADAGDRLEAMYKAPQNLQLQTWIVRAFGGLVVIGGLGMFIHALMS